MKQLETQKKKVEGSDGETKQPARPQKWNTHWRLLHPLSAQKLVMWLEHVATTYPPEVLRSLGERLASIPACLEFPAGELTTPGLSGWLLIWRLNHRLSELYPPDESKGRFNCQGLEFLLRVEDESLLTVLLAAQHIRQWRFAISLHISAQEVQAHIFEVTKEKVEL